MHIKISASGSISASSDVDSSYLEDMAQLVDLASGDSSLHVFTNYRVECEDSRLQERFHVLEGASPEALEEARTKFLRRLNVEG